MGKYFGVNKGWFNTDDSNTLEHRAKYGTADSTSEEKGIDNKKNNTSKYNHDYYVKYKEKWQDNKESHDENSKDDSDKEKEEEFDIDEAARDVIRGKYGDGEERKEALGEDYAMVQKRVNELMKQMKGSGSETSEEKKAESKDSSEGGGYEAAKKKYYADKNAAKEAASQAQERGKARTEKEKKKKK